jgi:hypothetical protein
MMTSQTPLTSIAICPTRCRAGVRGRPERRSEREFDYTGGAEQALERAEPSGWTVVSIKNDWAKIFANEGETHE